MAGDGTGEFRYWAFVSYSSKDRDCARRLHKALETYRIPKDLRGRPGRDGPVPEKIFPVFRDRDELPLSSDLGGTIQDALWASRYLVVICSPNAARSQWVNEEIRYFKSLGRGDRILALILAGEPGATAFGQPENESFPEALRFEVDALGQITDKPCEPIGGDLRKGGDGWQRSFLKAVAGITGLGFDAFARREAKRARRRRIVAGVFATMFLVGGIFAWDYFRLKTDYYQEMTFAYGEPVGLGELSDSLPGRRYQTYRFRHSRGRVRSVEVVNSKGFLAEVDSPGIEYPAFSRLEVEYDESGRVDTHRYFQHAGDEILQLVFSDDLKTVDRVLPGEEGSTAAGGGSLSIGSSGWAASWQGNLNGESSSVISRYLLELDGRGMVTAMNYRNAWGAPVRDQDGAFALRLERDDAGRIVRATSVDGTGKAVTSKLSGAASKVMVWNGESQLIEERFLDGEGQPVVLRTAGFATVKTSYDAAGNDIERRFFDENDQPCARHRMHHRILATYTNDGVLRWQDYFRQDGTPGRDIPGGVERTVYQFDERGWLTKLGSSTRDGKPMPNASGVCGFVQERDTRGRIVALSYLGASDEPVIEPVFGAHRIAYSYDGGGRVISTSFYGPDGDPVRGKPGYHKELKTLDPAGRTKEAVFFGPEGEPCVESEERTHRQVSDYDERGNLRSLKYEGNDDRPCLAASGYHEMRRSWNERGLLLSESYFDLNERPVMRNDWNLHEIRFDYNEVGNVINRRYFGLRDELVCDENGVHEERSVWDDKGNRIRESYFDDRGEPMIHNSLLAHELRRTFDHQGRELTLRYYGPDGEAMMHPDGLHELRENWDDFGNKESESYFDTEGNPVERRDLGCHRVAMEFDELGRKTAEAYFGLDGGPVRRQSRHLGEDETAGWPHRREWDFNESGSYSEVRNLDTDGSLLCLRDAGAVERRSYDDRGHLTRIKQSDGDGLPYFPHALGWSAKSFEYRGDGIQSAEAYFGADGEPILFGGSYHKLLLGMDALGRQTGYSYYGTRSEKILHPESGIHEMRKVLNEFGQTREERTYGLDGEPVLSDEGIHLFKIDYDGNGHYRSRRGYGLDGEPAVVNSYGAHEQREEISLAGDLLRQEFFDVDGKACIGVDGFHRMEKTYWRTGLARSCRFFGVDGKPMRAGSSASFGWEQDFDSRGLVTEVRTVGEEGELVNSTEGYARKTIEYDQFQRPFLISEYFADGTVRRRQKAIYAGKGSHEIQSVETLEEAPAGEQQP